VLWRFLLNRSLANSERLRYAASRYNQETMLITTNTHMFLAEAATAASALSRWHKPVETGSQADYVPALAERWMR
jgi:hypothetical protein